MSASILKFSCFAPFPSPCRVYAELNPLRSITKALPLTAPDPQSNGLCYTAVKFPKTQWAVNGPVGLHHGDEQLCLIPPDEGHAPDELAPSGAAR